MVSGVVARMIEANPAMTPDQVKAALTATAGGRLAGADGRRRPDRRRPRRSERLAERFRARPALRCRAPTAAARRSSALRHARRRRGTRPSWWTPTGTAARPADGRARHARRAWDAPAWAAKPWTFGTWARAAWARLVAEIRGSGAGAALDRARSAPLMAWEAAYFGARRPRRRAGTRSTGAPSTGARSTGGPGRGNSARARRPPARSRSRCWSAPVALAGAAGVAHAVATLSVRPGVRVGRGRGHRARRARHGSADARPAARRRGRAVRAHGRGLGGRHRARAGGRAHAGRRRGRARVAAPAPGAGDQADLQRRPGRRRPHGRGGDLGAAGVPPPPSSRPRGPWRRSPRPSPSPSTRRPWRWRSRSRAACRCSSVLLPSLRISAPAVGRGDRASGCSRLWRGTRARSGSCSWCRRWCSSGSPTASSSPAWWSASRCRTSPRPRSRSRATATPPRGCR